MAAESVDVDSSTSKRKHRGIPEAIFLDDVEGYMKNEGSGNAEGVIGKLDEQYQKYRFMEANLNQKRLRLKGQIPEIKCTLDAINYLESKEDSEDAIKTQFLLSDQLYVNAEIPPTKTVCLWLGANVMLEYEIEEAAKLLTKNMETAISNLGDVETDLNFLRDQITTSEVSILF
eukprot:gene198-812_t